MKERSERDREWLESKRVLRKLRRKQFLKMAAFAIPFWFWTAFCFFGAMGIVGEDQPYLVALLGTAVFALGIFLAIPTLNRWFDDV